MRERGERREKTKPKLKLQRYLHKNENCAKILPLVTNWGGGGGGGGAYIGHPMYENTRKPNILANTRDKEVIHRNEVG